jgi:hypothetical protein
MEFMVPLDRMFTDLWSMDFGGSFRFSSDALLMPGLKLAFSMFCLALLYLEVRSTLLKTLDVASLPPILESRENPYVDFIGDILLETEGLPSGQLESSSRRKGRQSS